jgi:anti-sigma factor RsiW
MKQSDRKIIHKAIDGEANRDETKILKRTLETDPQMRREYEQLKAVDEGSKEVVRPIEVPDNFKEKVIGKIRDTAHRKRAE